jgi:hypothetical protein
MSNRMGFDAALHLNDARAEAAEVRSFRHDGGLIVAIELGDLTVYGNGKENLATTLRRLADRVDAAMADLDDPGPVLAVVA